MTTTLDSNLYSVMNARKSVRVFDTNATIAKEEIVEMLKLATIAPSSSNLQSWSFIVFQDAELKKELKTIANNQAAVEDSSAVIAVLGNIDAYKKVEQIYTQNVAEGHMDDSIKDFTIASTNAVYPNMPREVRANIASFDAGLVSMQLMLIAKEKGYDTLPMGGFDKVKFAERFDLSADQFPVVLIALGKAAAPAYGSSRLPLDEVVRFI
ncbi:nitroreductase family protein [Sporosarcina sp. E16_8]|uniref:nitroreductase family protein n=1 Tax=Sporosarcina sp. E16_8 TaxID=2789295 RepID=UPI001A91FC19|nr:nitroreductase family protein [Sporosarcina sp. E16_8]MBO0586707.1 nitroreductase family protein [Sporosarcina sp. E16_8]